jgi:hypothetical protein
MRPLNSEDLLPVQLHGHSPTAAASASPARGQLMRALLVRAQVPSTHCLARTTGENFPYVQGRAVGAPGRPATYRGHVGNGARPRGGVALNGDSSGPSGEVVGGARDHRGGGLARCLRAWQAPGAGSRRRSASPDLAAAG